MNGKLACALLLVVLLTQFAIHFIFVDKEVFNDEGQYLTYGFLITKGYVPYRDFFDHHSPAISYISAAMQTLFPNSFMAARMLVFLFQAANTVLVFYLARKISNRYDVALISAALYVLLEFVWMGIWFVTQPFVAVVYMLSLILLYEYFFEKGDAKVIFLGGFFLGLSLLFRQTAIWTVILGSVWVVYKSMGGAKKNLAGREIVFFFLGIAIPLVALIAAVYSIGIPQQFWNCVIWFNLFVLGRDGGFYLDALEFFSYFLFAVTSWYCLAKVLKNWHDSLIFVIFAVAGFLEVFPNAYNYHVLSTAPLIALGLGFGACWIAGGVRGIINVKTMKTAEVVKIVAAATYFAFCFVFLGFLVYTMLAVGLFEERETNYPKLKYIADYIANDTQPSDRLFTFPWKTELYFLSGRLPASRYTFFVIAQPSTSLSKYENESIEDLERTKPRYVVFENYNETGLMRQVNGSVRKDYNYSKAFPRIVDYIFMNYETKFSEFNETLFVMKRKGS